MLQIFKDLSFKLNSGMQLALLYGNGGLIPCIFIGLTGNEEERAHGK